MGEEQITDIGQMGGKIMNWAKETEGILEDVDEYIDIAKGRLEDMRPYMPECVEDDFIKVFDCIETIQKKLEAI